MIYTETYRVLNIICLLLSGIVPAALFAIHFYILLPSRPAMTKNLEYTTACGVINVFFYRND